MKKGFLILYTLLAATSGYAQDPSDALRFSFTAPGGTARQQAIGGSMGSLGGDYSATFVNPAGLGFYHTSDALLTPAFHWSNTRATYIGRSESSNDRRFDLNALGLVLGGSHNGKGMAVTLGFTTQADFRSELLYRGRNNSSSYSQRFIEELARNGVRDSTAAYLYPFGSSLALNTYWLDPVRNSSGQVTGFSTNSPIASGLLQEQKISNRGGMYEFAIGAGAQVTSKWFFGATVGVPILYYNRKSTFTEADAGNDTSNRFDYAAFQENLTTKGTGLNLRLGAIYKPAEFWRLGLALQTPTLYSLTDEFDYTLTTNTEHYQGELYDASKDYNDGNANEFKYRMTTPWKATGSISYVLREIEDVTKQRGFLTADVEYVHYRGMRYLQDADQQTDDSGNKDYFKSVNKTIKDIYKGAFNFRVGGELKFTTLMFRAGAAWYGNPYKDVNGGTGNRFNLSGGIGYRHKGLFIDLTYVHSQQKDLHAPYRLADAAYYVAETKRTQGNVLLTFGTKF
ncbi:OmpP1/FadL family transporter [Flaviaesturariibacter terrae]